MQRCNNIWWSMGELVGWRRDEYRVLAKLMDIVGWRRFMKGTISKEVVAIQGCAVDNGRCRLSLRGWSAGLVTKLLEVTHEQRLYQNAHVHNAITGKKARYRRRIYGERWSINWH